LSSEASQIVVKKAVTFARQLNIPFIGVVEDMSGLICPKCCKIIDVLKIGGG